MCKTEAFLAIYVMALGNYFTYFLVFYVMALGSYITYFLVFYIMALGNYFTYFSGSRNENAKWQDRLRTACKAPVEDVPVTKANLIQGEAFAPDTNEEPSCPLSLVCSVLGHLQPRPCGAVLILAAPF